VCDIGSSGLKRMARVACAIATSASPAKFRIHALLCQAVAKFGLSSRARRST
jgi:hypothetical protein